MKELELSDNSIIDKKGFLNSLILKSGKIYTFLLVLSLFGIVFAVTLQIVFRYLFNSPLIWTDEMSRLFFCWFTFTGSALASYEEKHLEVSYFYNKFSMRVRKGIDIFNNILIFVFSLLILYAVINQIISGITMRSSATRMPLVIFPISLLLGFIGITIYSWNITAKLLRKVK